MSHPNYQILINDTDHTDRFQGRVMEITITDNRGFEADQLSITLDDHDNALELPQTGAEIQLHMGLGDQLSDMGKYTVDEIQHQGPPDQIAIVARSANLREGLKAQHSKAWDNVALGDIISTIASKHNLTPAISNGLANIQIKHLAQTDESDIHFITRLAKQYDAIATVKHNNLLFMQAGMGQTASGHTLPVLLIERRESDTHTYVTADRDGSYSGVMARWYNDDAAKSEYVTIGKAGNLKKLKKSHSDREQATQAATAEHSRITRQANTMSINRGPWLNAMPDQKVTLQGYKAQIVDQQWVITKLTHKLSNGLRTTVELESG